jgi:glycosyltransferase involved in cell wall biosynthesis
MPKIFITSYPYVYERYFKVFDYFKNKKDLVFILPSNWQAKKKGRYFAPPKRDDIKIITTKAYFWHSHYWLIGGLMKGWMPGTGRILKGQSHPGDILFTVNEPNHLSVLYNAFLAKKYKLKHVIYADQNVSYKKRMSGLKLKFVEWIIRKNIELATKIFYSNKKSREILLNYCPPEKLIFAPESGVDTEKFKPGLKSDWRLKYNLENKVVFCFAGMLEARKGIIETLEAFKFVSEKVSDVAFLFIGFGPEKERAIRFVKENNLRNKVVFVDFVSNDELPYFLSNIDVSVCYSLPLKGWEEQLGYSIKEALASGIPVISTKSGSIDEAVMNGENGFLVEPHDDETLASRMLILAQDSQERLRMGQNARDYAIKTFSHEAVARILENALFFSVGAVD